MDENGEPHGIGKWMYSDEIYEGEWKHGKYQGEGTYKWHGGKFDGDIYEGQYKDGEKDGKGTYTSILMGDHMRENTKTAKGTVTELTNFPMEARGMMENGKAISSMERELAITKMMMSTLEDGVPTRSMAKEK